MMAISFTLGLRQCPATTTAWHLCTHHPETHSYRPACAWTGLATPRRTSLAVQKDYRLEVGVADDRRRRAMTKTSNLHEYQDHGGVESVYPETAALSQAAD
jgi:hypothetical protein